VRPGLSPLPMLASELGIPMNHVPCRYFIVVIEPRAWAQSENQVRDILYSF